MVLIVLGIGCLIGGVLMGLSIIRDFVSEKIEAEVIRNYVEHYTNSRGAKRKEYFVDIKYNYQGQQFVDRIPQKSRKKEGDTILICRRKNCISEYYPLKDFVYFTISLVIGLITLAIILNI